jgi:hypothetical protein
LISANQHKGRIFFLSLCLLIGAFAFAQNPPVQRQDSTTATQDTLPVRQDTTKRMIPADSIPKVATPMSRVDKVDSLLRHHSPKKAAIRSAILPGWGQIYNRKYWKLPIVYGALGVSGAIFNYNLTWYKRTRFAYKAKYELSQPRIDPITGISLPADSTNYYKIRPDLLPIDLNALRSYRDEFRRNIDYSALFFILMWGLNVVDATVDAHLKPFDVSPDLSLRFKIGPSEMARTSGVSLVLAFDDGKRQTRNGNWKGF